MRLSEAFSLYESSIETTTAHEHGGKIKKYITFVGDVNISNERAFSYENLRNFIFDGTQKALGKYSAIKSFYEFTKVQIEHQSKNTVNFPIYRNDVRAFDSENNNSDESDVKEKGAVYLEKKFDFKQFFEDFYYEHLKNETAVKTIKAAISLGLTAGYDSGEMFFTRKPPSFTLNDIELIDNGVRVRNFNNASMVEWITVIGDFAKYIIEYYELRKSYISLPEREKNIFFIQIYDTYKLEFDNAIQDRKPYTVQLLVLYFLKYISKAINLERELNVKDLKSNMVLHSLYKSQGASLHQIIRTFGYPPFVQNAFEKYCSDSLDNGLYILFEDSHFFHSSPLEKEDNTLDAESSGETRAKQYLVNKQVRDSNAVKILKTEYDNICQICGEPLVPIEGLSYSEACHIHPLSEGGSDDKTNMLILCPNHHTIFDLGVITISPEDLKTIIHADNNHHSNIATLKIIKHQISSTNVRYHYSNIFLPLLRSLERN
ncbi:MAG: hypothetical protein APF76_18380 [Desulfitibacter sp. BRH_c19]|nr:MAG: hypothetical protein APF76_18380 [Desulfitibacter sp. BRH_c19]